MEVVRGGKVQREEKNQPPKQILTALFPKQHTPRHAHEPPEFQVHSGERREKQQLEGWHEELV